MRLRLRDYVSYLGPWWWNFDEACFWLVVNLELGRIISHVPVSPGPEDKLIFTIFSRQLLFDLPLYLFAFSFSLPSLLPLLCFLLLPSSSLPALCPCLAAHASCVSHSSGPEESRFPAPGSVLTGRQGEAADGPEQGHSERDRRHDGGKWRSCDRKTPACADRATQHVRPLCSW